MLENRKKSSEVGLNDVLRQKDEQISGLMEEGLLRYSTHSIVLCLIECLKIAAVLQNGS